MMTPLTIMRRTMWILLIVLAIQILNVFLSSGWWLAFALTCMLVNLIVIFMVRHAYKRDARLTVPKEQFDPWLRKLQAYADSIQRRCADPLQTVDHAEVEREMECYLRELEAMFNDNGGTPR